MMSEPNWIFKQKESNVKCQIFEVLATSTSIA
jgi:hypothetical protein